MQFLEYARKLVTLSVLNTAVCLEPVKNQCDFIKVKVTWCVYTKIAF